MAPARGAACMYNYLKSSKVLGLALKGTSFQNGIFFQTGGNPGVSGHIDVMFGGKPTGGFYRFDCTYYWGK